MDDDPELVEFATKPFGLARTGQTGALVAYVDAGAPADLCDDSGDTLPMPAACHGRSRTVRAPFERGADPGRPDDRGQAPLAGAVFKKEPDVVRAPLDAGTDPHGGTPPAVGAARTSGHDDLLGWFAA